MTDASPPILFLPGAGAIAPDLRVLKAAPSDSTRLEIIDYPGWQRYVTDGYSGEALIADLTAQIEARVPRGPIRMIGYSLGGHFGYAAALRLQAAGRPIAGLCLIDSYMIDSTAPSAGWQRRAAAEALRLIRLRRTAELANFLRSKMWRALLRMSEGRLPGLLRRVGGSADAATSKALDPVLEHEMSMRLLLRISAPWVASLDRDPVVLDARCALIRTSLSAGDDAAWRRRCPNLEVYEVFAGDNPVHDTLFYAEHVDRLREAYLKATPDWR